MKCFLASTRTRTDLGLHAGNIYRTRGGNNKPCVFPPSRLRFTLKPGPKVCAVLVLCIHDGTSALSRAGMERVARPRCAATARARGPSASPGRNRQRNDDHGGSSLERRSVARRVTSGQALVNPAVQNTASCGVTSGHGAGCTYTIRRHPGCLVCVDPRPAAWAHSST